MTCARPLRSRILLASAFALTVFGAAPALAKPASTTKPADVKGESMSKDHKDMMQGSMRCDSMRVQSTNGISSDPEEGGQATAAKKSSAKPHISDMTVTKTTDKSSTKLMDSAMPGHCGH